MKINDRYEIRTVILEVREGVGVHRSIGDVYDNFEEFRADHPDSDYKFGYVVYDTETELVPDECNEWNDTPEEAMVDYEDHVDVGESALEQYVVCYETEAGAARWERINGEATMQQRVDELAMELGCDPEEILVFLMDSQLY